MESSKNMKVVIVSVLITVLVLTGGFFIYRYLSGSSADSKVSKDVYTCPMHPQIVQDRPGQCPICGMDLVLKSKLGTEDQIESKHNIGTDISEVKLSPSEQVLANVQTEKVHTMNFSGEKTFNGYVKVNEKNSAHISTAVGGKIVTMYVNFEGQYVSKGQAVFEMYSPELVATQKEYLLALKNLSQVKNSTSQLAVDQASSLVDAAKKKLLLLEMTPRQVEELERSGQVRNTLTQYSKYSGIITKKYNNVGHWAMAGEDIYDVTDMSSVWVIANIYESDVRFIKTGQTALISAASYPDEEFAAKINYINPVYNQDSRTMEVRLDVSNHNGKLKPDMYVQVKLVTYAGQSLAVPRNAVIRTGEKNIVYIVKEKGVYVPREVQISYEQDGYYAVISGLKEGEEVVSSGGFLIDSESQIESGLNAGHRHGDNNPNNPDNDMKINPDQDIMKDMKKMN